MTSPGTPYMRGMGGGSFTASGKVRAQGLPEQVLRPALLRSVFQLEAEIHPDPISRRPMCVMK